MQQHLIKYQKIINIPNNIINNIKKIISIEDILTSIEKLALLTHLEIQDIRCLENNEIELNANSQYINIIDFLNKLLLLSYNLAFKEIIIQKNNHSIIENELDFKIILTVTQEPIKITKLISTQNNIFIKQINTTNLLLWDESELIFLGKIEQNNKTYGFVCDPSGATHQLAIGDIIGLKSRKILKINNDGIITQ